MRLKRVGDLAYMLYCTSTEKADLDDAITAYEAAVKLVPYRHQCLTEIYNQLGISLLSRFAHFGNMADIDNAIFTFECSLVLIPDGNAAKPGYLNNLGNSFACRFQCSGDLIDLHKAIVGHKRAICLTLDDHAKSRYLGNLGHTLACRFGFSRDINDIDEAISTHQQAVHLTDDHADKPACLSNLGNSFLYRFEHLGELIDVNKAISAYEQALSLIPDGHPDKPGCWNNLGNALVSCYKHFGDAIDVMKAISALEHAVRLTDGHADKPACLSNLGNSFLYRFEHLGDLGDVDKAISAYKQATSLIPDGHAEKLGCLNNLGSSFVHRFEHTKNSIDLDAAISCFCLAATSIGSPSTRLYAAIQWARLASGLFALRGYAVALNLLPQVALLGQTTIEQCGKLSSISEITNEAAAAAISIEHHATALEWLEQGRSIVCQLHNLQTPIQALHDREPSLFNELLRVSRALEHASSWGAGISNVSTQLDQQLSMERAAQHHQNLATEWEMLLKRTSSLQGFKDFLQPKRLAELCNAAKSGPVVVINVHKHSCDALVLMAGLDEIVHIPLHSFSFEKAQQLHQSLNQLFLASGVHDVRDTQATLRAMTTKHTDLQSILSVLWSCVVEPVLDGLAFSVSFF
jgi:tetratricopeptide (TPR) repeat protein